MLVLTDEINDMLLTDWIRAAVAGTTADKREITELQLEDIASSYSQETYNARIWPEHIRGIAPDGMFKALGDVVEVKAERITGGALSGKLALYTKLSPHPDLIAMVRNGQKVHLSIEINPSFADTGKAYLMGIGVTDSPASLGTGIMKFSTAQRQENLFSTPQQTDINIKEADMNPELFKQLLAEALKPFADRLEKLEGHYSTMETKQDQIIELATPPAGNRYQYREPHNGGDPERKKNVY